MRMTPATCSAVRAGCLFRTQHVTIMRLSVMALTGARVLSAHTSSVVPALAPCTGRCSAEELDRSSWAECTCRWLRTGHVVLGASG